MSKGFKRVEALTVLKNGVKVGELFTASGRGIYFAYDPGWLAAGYNLSPLTMDWGDKPQLAKDRQLFDGLHGPFADSLPDGWGMLLMDRFFDSTFGDGTRYSVTALDRVAYMEAADHLDLQGLQVSQGRRVHRADSGCLERLEKGLHPIQGSAQSGSADI